jgi:transcriptional regulator GlxA family with amidase domain
MEQNIGSPISIREIASRIEITSRTLERLFLRHLGHGPRTSYMTLRLKHARWMLRSRKSIAQIAIETGFKNCARLSSAFKRQYGHSPTEERANTVASATTVMHPSFSFDGEQPRVFDPSR